MLTLPEALDSIRGRREFAVRRLGGVVVVNYLLTLPDSFEGVRRELRGVTFDELTGAVVSLPFHKFFNVNERPETQFHAIKHLRAEVYEKLDGSLIHAYRHPATGELTLSTRMGSDTPQAQAALAFARSAPELWRLIGGVVDGGATPLFELVGPDNLIVVSYPARRLVYLASRDRATGDYSFDERFPDKARRHDIAFGDIEAHLGAPETEGYVCRLETGLWVKAKGEWYRERHRAVDDLMRPAYRLYEMALGGKLGVVTALAAERHRPQLDAIRAEAARDFAGLAAHALSLHADLVSETPAGGRKGYAVLARARHPDLFTALMLLYEGRDAGEILRRRLMERYRAEKTHRLHDGGMSDI